MPSATTPGSNVTLLDESSSTKFVVRAAAGTSARAVLAQSFGASRRVGGALIVGIRPDEWFVLGSAADVAERIDQIDSSAGHVSIVDWTHGRAQFRLGGPDAKNALEKVCSLDWSDAMMPNGAATSASVAKVACDIVRDDADASLSYLVLCDRSFGQYLFEALLDAATEFQS